MSEITDFWYKAGGFKASDDVIESAMSIVDDICGKWGCWEALAVEEQGDAGPYGIFLVIKTRKVFVTAAIKTNVDPTRNDSVEAFGESYDVSSGTITGNSNDPSSVLLGITMTHKRGHFTGAENDSGAD